MVRTFLDFAIVAAGTPQPFVGTVSTAAFGPSGGDARDQTISIPVSDSSIAKAGDSVLVQETDGTKAERVKVFSIPDGTHIKVDGLANSHASGARVILSIPTQSTYLQEQDGNAGTIFIGNRRDMVTATGVGVIAKLMKVAAGTQPGEWSDSRAGAINGAMSSDYWLDGTTNDKYRITLGVI